MSSISMIASDIMDTAATLQNDTSKAVYTYDVQYPFLNMALRELQELFELNNIPVTNQTSDEIEVEAEVDTIGFQTSPAALPQDLVEIQQLWYRQSGTDFWYPLDKREFLPHYLSGVDQPWPLVWAWVDQSIKLLPSTNDIELKLDYIKSLFPNITDPNQVLGVVNCESFLQYRTAALLADFIGEDDARADKCNGMAILAVDRALGIGVKGKQNIMTRRRPFRAGWKGRRMVI